MRTQTIQKIAQIGNHIQVTLTTGNQVSGQLIEISLDHVTLDLGGANGKIAISVESISTVQSTDSINALEPPSKTPNSSDKDDMSDSLNSEQTEIEVQNSVNYSSSAVEVAKSSDSSTGSIDLIPEQVTARDPSNSNPASDKTPSLLNLGPKSEESVDSEASAFKKLTEIDNKFNTSIENIKIELEPPDLTFPAEELTGWQSTTVAGDWVRIKNKYEHAKKINELSPKHGRIQPIVTELKSLTERFPNSPALKRVLAYFHSISENWNEALKNYQMAAVQSGKADDWFDVAVSALKLNKEELTCYSLGKYFLGVPIIEEPQVWYIYVNLLEKFNNLPVFRELCKIDKYDIKEAEIGILLDTAIYLLQKTGSKSSATEIIQKRRTEEVTKPLLEEARQKLHGEPVESYRQFVNGFINAMVASEKKIDSIMPQTPKHINSVKQLIPQPTSKKRKRQTHGTSGGKDLYREAERANTIEKDLEKAERLYRECIRQNIRFDSAVKDLAMVLDRLERSKEAAELLEQNRKKAENRQSFENLLINVYQKIGEYKKAIQLLNDALNRTQDSEKSAQIRWQIASNYVKLEKYAIAEKQFRQVRELLPDNITVQRNLALCLSKQGNYDEAKQILNQIQNTSPDAKTADLLETIERARTTGEFILVDDIIVDDIIIETVLSDFSGELSEFAQFFLERCTFDAVPPGRVNEGKYKGSEEDFRYDIRRLENIAKQLGTRRPRERSHYYLSAARICFDLGAGRDFFYRYLCRSFASRGDAAVSENKHLDTAREWYYEALRIYDGIQDPNFDEQDAVNALSRFLFSYLGIENIPTSPPERDENAPILEQQIEFIAGAVENVISNHSEKNKVFDGIGYLLHSRYAARRILSCLDNKPALQNEALKYLQNNGIRVSEWDQAWQQLRDKNFNEARAISTNLRLLSNFDFQTALLEDSIKTSKEIYLNLFFELDQQRVGELQRILETALELCREVKFEERERLCSLLDRYCQDLLEEIEESPTQLSVEDVYPIIKIIQEKVKTYLAELYETSKPQLGIRLAVESYVPDTHRNINVQIVVENEIGRSPAESLELVIQGAEEFFEDTEQIVSRSESLRGGERSILEATLHLTPEALQSRTFSLPVKAQYDSRGNTDKETLFENLPIRLYSEDEFEDIENPYAAYAEGGIVGDVDMFFGREELIENIAQSIRESRTQSKCVLVFGQKRSGKSSVLYHLKELLQDDENLLILDLENIASILGEDSNQHADSKTSLLNQILKSILTQLEYAIEDQGDKDFTPLDIQIPSDQDFYSHPNPQQYFVNTFTNFKRQISRQEDWNGIRVVLLIDEFQYIYARIVDDKIPASFMQSWKALLQANYFHAVLVGQDVMPKFKARFPNEFGTTQDERVAYLKPDEARRLIDEPIRIGGREGESRYREQAIERILDLTAGSPFYIQIICNRLVEYMNDRHALLVSEADVEQVKNELISGVNALGLDKFDNLINSGDISADAISDEDALKILKTIADNSSQTDPCPRDRIVCETQLPIDVILDDLEKRDVVKRRDQSYQIQVELFKEWLIVNG